MKEYVCSCTVGYIEDTPFVDLNYVEETAKGPLLTVATLPKSRKIVLLLVRVIHYTTCNWSVCSKVPLYNIYLFSRKAFVEHVLGQRCLTQYRPYHMLSFLSPVPS